jgi:hypothetical protein
MTIDLSGFSSWIWIIALLVILFIVLRYFLHIVVRFVQFVFRFFWLGCITVILLVVIYYILRALHIF